MNKDLKTVFVKMEASRGVATSAGAVGSFVDTNQSWVADKVKVGQVINALTGSNAGLSRKITSFDDGTNTMNFTDFPNAWSQWDRYEIVTDGGAMTSKSSVLAWMFPSGTAEATSSPTKIVDTNANANGEWANKGVRVGDLVYITGGGGEEGKGVITAIDYDPAVSELTITSVTGVTTASTYEIRPAPLTLFDVQHKFNIEMLKRNPLRATHTPMPSISTKRQSDITFKLELKGGETPANFGSGTPGAGAAPVDSPIFLACGFKEIIVAATSVTYSKQSEGVPAVTIVSYEDGVLKVSTGCRGTMKHTGNNGNPYEMDVSMKGKPIIDSSKLVTDEAMKVGLLYSGIIGPNFLGATLSIDDGAAFIPIISQLEFDMGDNVVMNESVADPSGFAASQITGREPKGSFNPNMELVATHDFYGNWLTGQLAELYAQFGSVTGNTIRIGSPSGIKSCRYTEVSDQDKEGVMGLAVPFELVRDAGDGDDEFEIKIT